MLNLLKMSSSFQLFMIFFRIISHIIYLFLLSLSLSKCEVGFTTSTNFSILLYYITLYLFIVVYHTLWKWNKGFGSLSIFFFLWWDIQCPRTQLMSCCLLFFFFFFVLPFIFKQLIQTTNHDRKSDRERNRTCMIFLWQHNFLV